MPELQKGKITPPSLSQLRLLQRPKDRRGNLGFDLKKKEDPRHLERIKALQELFAWSFAPKQKPQSKLATATIRNLKEINPLIEKHAPTWPIETVSPLDLSILRLAIYELLFQKAKTPYKVVIDEAVELGKEFGSDTTSAFINGVLGAIVEKQKVVEAKK